MVNIEDDAIDVNVLIVGAGHAGAECAMQLRNHNFSGTILLIGAEDSNPYQRPPLSKAYLLDETDTDRIVLNAPDLYRQKDIMTVFGDAVVDLNDKSRVVQTKQGRTISFGTCVLATGAAPRLLPGLSRAHVVRTIDDANRLKKDLKPGARTLILGGGYLGLEIASAAASLDANVSVLEQADSPMFGRVSAYTANRFQQKHETAGTQILCGVVVTEVIQEESIWRVKLSDETVICADLLVVTIGAIPNSEIASSAGIVCDNGIVVDHNCRTSSDHVYAIGDCSTGYYQNEGRLHRVESVQNALEQARVAAACISGVALPKRRVPTFWSEQHGHRLQVAGLVNPAIDYKDLTTDTDNGWLVERYHDDVLCVVEAVDSPVEFMRSARQVSTQPMCSK